MVQLISLSTRYLGFCNLSFFPPGTPKVHLNLTNYPGKAPILLLSHIVTCQSTSPYQAASITPSPQHHENNRPSPPEITKDQSKNRTEPAPPSLRFPIKS